MHSVVIPESFCKAVIQKKSPPLKCVEQAGILLKAGLHAEVAEE
jgi:hypothetical protein